MRSICPIAFQHQINVKDQTPQEAWNGMKPSINYSQAFQSIAYGHVAQQERSKLDDPSIKYVFIIGYDSHSKGYKLYKHDC